MSNEDINVALDRIYPSLSSEKDKKTNDIYIPSSDVYTTNYEVMGIPGNKKERKTWIYIIIALVLLIFLFVIIVLLYNYFINVDSSSTTTETNDENANIGAMLTINEYYALSGNFNRRMIKNSQIILEKDELLSQSNTCDYGYYTGNKNQIGNNINGNLISHGGSDGHCGFQSHSSNYYNVGSFPMEYTKTYIGKHVLSLNYDDMNFDGVTGSGSRSHNGATYICDHTDGCFGIEYNHRTQEAYIITSDIKATYPSTNISSNNIDSKEAIALLDSNKPKLDFSKDTQIYIKKKLRPEFTNVVFGYSGTRPLRYYMTHSQVEPDINHYHKRGTTKLIKSGTVRFPNGVKRELNWIPYRIANYGGLIGKYYDSSNNLIYTDTQVGEYNLPLNLHKYHKLYVVYSSDKS